MWIGYDSLIMPGITIGKGAVIGARSIVTKDVPPYSVYVGNKVIKKRFDEETIAKIQRIDFSRIEHIRTDKYAQFCQVDLTHDNVDKIIQSFEM